MTRGSHITTPTSAAAAIRDALDESLARVRRVHGALGDAFPSVGRGTSWELSGNDDWFAGFWPGVLWLTAAADPDHATAGDVRAHAASLLPSFAARLDGGARLDHDIGFLYTLSARAQWQLTADRTARALALRAADALALRFRAAGRYIQAWGAIGDPVEGGRVIVDSLMNAPLLWWAASERRQDERASARDVRSAEHGSDERVGERTATALADIALAHADTCAEHLIRADGSTYHTFLFDQDTGAAIGPRTDQGGADDSLWARGQAWAIYGLSLAQEWTGQARFSTAAGRVADRFLAELPADGVPTWDLRLPAGAPVYLDSSAGAIAAGGLLRLARAADAVEPGRGEDRRLAAERLILALIDRCLETDPAGQGLLRHGNYDTPRGLGVDGYLMFGDYFFLETLLALTGRAPDLWGPARG